MLRKPNSQPDEFRKGQPPTFSKETSFDKNWGKLGSTQQREAHSGRGLLANRPKQDLNCEIFVSMNLADMDAPPNTAALSSAMTNALAKASASSKAPAPLKRAEIRIPMHLAFEKTDATSTNLGPREVLIVMWQHLEIMADQYNRAVGIGPFQIDMPREISGTARATMKTSTHALILIPDTDAVRMYVLPIELSRGLYSNGPQFEPNCIFLMNREKNNIEWQTMAGAALTMNTMNWTCQSLFQTLIEQTAARIAS